MKKGYLEKLINTQTTFPDRWDARLARLLDQMTETRQIKGWNKFPMIYDDKLEWFTVNAEVQFNTGSNGYILFIGRRRRKNELSARGKIHEDNKIEWLKDKKHILFQRQANPLTIEIGLLRWLRKERLGDNAHIHHTS